MTLLSSQRIHTGRVVSLDIDTVQFPNGNVGTLEIFRHPGAAAILPFLDDPQADDPRVLLIRQFRHATGDFLWEIPAGRRDIDEHPDDTAHRELCEETGYRCGRLEKLTQIWTTPGFTDEVIHLYLAANLTSGESTLEPDEVLAVHQFRWSELLQMLRTGVIVDCKTISAILYTHLFVRHP